MTAQILVVLHHESRPLKKNCFGTPFCFNFFLPNTFSQLTLQVFFFTFICVRNRARSVSFSDGGFCGRDIIQRSNVSFILALETNRSNSWRRSASTYPVSWECVFFSLSFFLSFSLSFFLSFCLFFFSFLLITFFHLFAQRRRNCRKKWRKRAVPFTRFLDYRLMFDSDRGVN